MKSNLSLFSIFLVIASCFIINFSLKLWTKSDRVIEHDIKYYYGYLPLKFIYDDLKIEKNSYQTGKDDFWIWAVRTDEDKPVLKMTCGLAILYSPFFLTANYTAKFFGYPATGFTTPYKFFLILGTMFYLYLGLFYTMKILLHFKFEDIHIAVTILLLGLATNLLAYATQQAPMTHVYSFALFALFIYYTIKWHEHPKHLYFIAIAFLFGLITLVRISNAVVILFFIFYNVKLVTDLFKKRITWREILIMVFVVLLVWSPQIAYWKLISGNYFVYSYNEEKFFFLQPMFYKGLFSFRKGWLIYTPVMAFAIFGLFKLRDELNIVKLAILFYFIINLYVVFSWWCWWYGGSIGQRALIESYAVLAIPLAAFVKYIFNSSPLRKITFGLLCLFFVWLNIFQIYQYENRSLHHEGMNQKLYFKQFGKIKPIPDYDKYVAWPNFKKAMQGDR